MAIDPLTVFKLVALLLWCYAGLLAIAWVRAVANSGQRNHVSHVVGLLGELVPPIAILLVVIMIGSVVGLPSVVVFISVLFPAGLIFAFVTELHNLIAPTRKAEITRIAVAALLAVLYLLWRGVP